MEEGLDNIRTKIRSFQHRFYLSVFIRGSLITLTVLSLYYLVAIIVEYNLWLSPWIRSSLFFSFIFFAVLCFYFLLKDPVKWWVARHGLSEEESAKIIGKFLPGVKDHLLNLIQLKFYSKSSLLAEASIHQRTKELLPLSFDAAVNLNENRIYLRYLSIPLVLLLLVLIINKSIVLQSTERIVHFNQEYSPVAPFQFVLVNKSLTAFYNEDYLLTARLEGQALPDKAYLHFNHKRIPLARGANGEFFLLFEKIQEGFTFQIEAAGFFSKPFVLELSNRPELVQFKLNLEFPKYLQRKNTVLENSGNLEIPEGTTVHWNLSTSHSDKASILFDGENQWKNMQHADDQLFIYSKRLFGDTQYTLSLENPQSKNLEKITYHIDVIPDEYPQISLNKIQDSVLYNNIVLGGLISDDYGLSELKLHFEILNESQQPIEKGAFNISLLKNQAHQSFFYNWVLDSIHINPGQQLQYYLEVWDNDGVRGRKQTKTGTYTFNVPSQKNLLDDIEKTQHETEQSMGESSEKASKLHDKVQEISEKLKGKQTLDWQEKKLLEDLIQQKKDLDNKIDQLKDKNNLLDIKKDAFTEQDKRIKEKAEQIKKLMDELLDEETKKLFEELQKLLNQNNADLSQVQKLLDKLKQNTNNLEKELERTLELFKQLEYDFKLDQSIKQLNSEIESLKSIKEKTAKQEDKSGKDGDKGNDNQEGDKESDRQDIKDLAEDQKKLNEDFQETSKDLNELKKLGDELNKPDELPKEKEKEEINKDLNDSKDFLDQNSPSKAQEKQNRALEKMRKMSEKMEGMQSSMEMEMDMQNIESLRQIIHGLIKLSFDQENLINQFHNLQQNDPLFNHLAQQQLKLKDDAKVLEDSLLSLSKRDPFMGSVVSREINSLNAHLDEAIEANRERKRPQAASEMQFSMTSINNLALMLDSHFDMMMQMMLNAKPSLKKSKQKGGKPNLSQLQQQLNDRIEDLKNSGKTGRPLSEELAKMAAEQERIRKALQEMQEKMKMNGQTPGGDLPMKMEQTEMDLVNKQLTDQLIRRQKDIVTRLLETEKSMREQDMDEERKGETAKDHEKEIPKAFEEYLRLKEKEVELLKTVPPKLYPYYKKEVNEYFKRMSNQ